MNFSTIRNVLFFAVIAVIPMNAKSITAFENASYFKASMFLSAELLEGPNHTVDRVVTNDGMLNRYLIRSEFGTVEANSTSEALRRIDEMNSLATLAGMKKSTAFKYAAKESGKQVLRGAEYLITHPVNSVKSVVSGATKMFSRAGNTLFARAPAENQDSRAKALLGFSATKRAYAIELGIDPYTDNELIQRELDQIAWTGYAGGVTTAIAFSVLPGAAGSATEVTRSTASGVDADLAKTPYELEKQNRASLISMGINESIVDLFLRNATFPPSLETQITKALSTLEGVEGRQSALEVVMQTSERDVAEYLREQLELYAGYHLRVGGLKKIHAGPNDSVIAAETREGEIVVIMPIDYLVWTQAIGRAFIAQDLNPGLANRDKSLWITGQFSPQTKQSLTELGWKTTDKAKKTLLAKKH